MINRTPEELLVFAEKVAPNFPYSPKDIFNWLVSLENFDWRTLTDGCLQILLLERVVRGY